MPELAHFCVLTAQEEAVVALFSAVAARRYSLSPLVKNTNHHHKAAVLVYMDALRSAAKPLLEQINCVFEFQSDSIADSEYLGLRFKVRERYDREYSAWIVPPLNVMLSNQLEGFDLTPKYEAMASEEGCSSIAEVIERRANRRNQALYAPDGGLPVIKFGEATWSLEFGRWLGLTVATLLVAQEEEKQLFVIRSVEEIGNLVDLLNKKRYPPKRGGQRANM